MQVRDNEELLAHDSSEAPDFPGNCEPTGVFPRNQQDSPHEQCASVHQQEIHQPPT